MIAGAEKRETRTSIEYRVRLYHQGLSLRIDRTRCIHCDVCQLLCPQEAIWVEADQRGLEIYLDENRCVLCEVCAYFCPADAIEIRFGDRPKTLLSDSAALPDLPPRIEHRPENCPLRCQTVSELERHWCRQQRQMVENRYEQCPKYCFHCIETCPREVFTEVDNQVATDPGNCLRCLTCLSRCEHGAIDIHPLFEGKIHLDADRCPADCDKCFQVCPVNLFERRDGRVCLVRDHCALCGACVNVCDQDALHLERSEILLPEGTPQRLWDRLRRSLLSGERVGPEPADEIDDETIVDAPGQSLTATFERRS